MIFSLKTLKFIICWLNSVFVSHRFRIFENVDYLHYTLSPEKTNSYLQKKLHLCLFKNFEITQCALENNPFSCAIQLRFE